MNFEILLSYKQHDFQTQLIKDLIRRKKQTLEEVKVIVKQKSHSELMRETQLLNSRTQNRKWM